MNVTSGIDMSSVLLENSLEEQSSSDEILVLLFIIFRAKIFSLYLIFMHLSSKDVNNRKQISNTNYKLFLLLFILSSSLLSENHSPILKSLSLKTLQRK